MSLVSYPLVEIEPIPSPAVLVYREILERNIAQMIALAGSPARLRPHCKTHKTREIIRLFLARGVMQHKCATLREAEMCLEAGARDVVIAYQLVPPNAAQLAALAARFPEARLAALVDEEAGIAFLESAARARGVRLGALVDLDTGAHRTGTPVGDGAARLYRRIAASDVLFPAGLHVFDPQNSHTDIAARREAVRATIEPVFELAEGLRAAGCAVPEIVCGASGTFPCYAQYAEVVCSPGTTVFWDYGYSRSLPDLDLLFTPAALVLGRVISRPTPQHVTLDIGTKAIAADPPQGRRGLILGLEDAQTALHNEEHWTVTSERASAFRLGDPLLVVPQHICPVSNLHPCFHVLDGAGRLQERWEVAARYRAVAT